MQSHRPRIVTYRDSGGIERGNVQLGEAEAAIRRQGELRAGRLREEVKGKLGAMQAEREETRAHSNAHAQTPTNTHANTRENIHARTHEVTQIQPHREVDWSGHQTAQQPRDYLSISTAERSSTWLVQATTVWDSV